MGGRALLLADAAPSAGLGHLARLTGLARALPESGLEPVCVALGAADPVEHGGTKWIPAPDLDSALVPADGPDLIVVDGYEIPLDSVRSAAGGAPVAAFWDEGEAPDADFLISFALEVPRGRGVSGPEYACLGPDYWEPPTARRHGPVERVLVSTGGADVDDAAGLFCAAARRAVPDAEVLLARGRHARHPPPADVEVVIGVPSLSALLMEADLAVTAAGLTMVEAAATGTPCVASPIATNQRAGAEMLAGLGAIRLQEQDSSVSLEDQIAELAGAPDLRRELSKRAIGSVDGRGALRIAAALAALRD